jgi:hypothetical protein
VALIWGSLNLRDGRPLVDTPLSVLSAGSSRCLDGGGGINTDRYF